MAMTGERRLRLSGTPDINAGSAVATVGWPPGTGTVRAAQAITEMSIARPRILGLHSGAFGTRGTTEPVADYDEPARSGHFAPRVCAWSLKACNRITTEESA
jgi:hypothetical protein